MESKELLKISDGIETKLWDALKEPDMIKLSSNKTVDDTLAYGQVRAENLRNYYKLLL